MATERSKNNISNRQLKNRIAKAVFSAAESTGLPDREMVEQMVEQVIGRLDFLEPTPGVLPGWEDLVEVGPFRAKVSEEEIQTKVKEVLDQVFLTPKRNIPIARQREIFRNFDEIEFDVAISFAGTEREYAKVLATLVRDAGFIVFYDAFYKEDLWGNDLYSLFDGIFRERSRYCVILVSAEYCIREWPNLEFRSALARLLKEKGKDYILPIKVDGAELADLNPTIGYVSLEEFSIEEIAQLLIKKLSSS